LAASGSSDILSSEILTFSFAADYRLGAKTSLTLEYIFTDEENEVVGVYSQNIVSLLLTRRF